MQNSEDNKEETKVDFTGKLLYSRNGRAINLNLVNENEAFDRYSNRYILQYEPLDLNLSAGFRHYSRYDGPVLIFVDGTLQFRQHYDLPLKKST